MTWLLTGGAGYIGSHISELFVSSGESLVIFDNLVSGSKKNIPKGASFFEGDVRSETDLDLVFKKFKVEGVINLAGLKSVSDSEKFHKEYFEVNTHGAKQVLEACIRHQVEMFIQSSTAAVYGNIEESRAHEATKKNPASNYGKTKLRAENLLESAINSGMIKGSSLRYFNVVGAKNHGLRDLSASNLFPILSNRLSKGLRPFVFGNDYPTTDGTCVRDYVHVEDIALGHLLAARKLKLFQIASSINLGTGYGYSVLQVINAMQAQRGTDLGITFCERRAGDVASLVANVDLAKAELGFQATRGLEEMTATTFD